MAMETEVAVAVAIGTGVGVSTVAVDSALVGSAILPQPATNAVVTSVRATRRSFTISPQIPSSGPGSL